MFLRALGLLAREIDSVSREAWQSQGRSVRVVPAKSNGSAKSFESKELTEM